MKKHFVFLPLILSCSTLLAQATFKADWTTYTIGSVVHEYNYTYPNKDSVMLLLTDSTTIVTAADSGAVVTTNYLYHDKNVYKEIDFFNPAKVLMRKEIYKNDILQQREDWQYDKKNRKISHIDDNKANGNVYKKYYEYTTEKKDGDQIITETSYFNGKVEFYTKTYINRKNVKYKEVRLADNNKDIVHIESFFYDTAGRLKERSVYFTEWKVIKKFTEEINNTPAKCLRILPAGIPDKFTPASKLPYIKKVLVKNRAVFADKDCANNFLFTFRNFANCDIVVQSTKINNARKVTLRYKEKP